MSILDEIEAVKSIYCQQGEFEANDLESSLSKSFKLNLTHAEENCQQLRITFYISHKYPEVVPHVTIDSPMLTRESSSGLNSEMSKFATENNLLNSQMLLDLILWIKDNVAKFASGVNSNRLQGCGDEGSLAKNKTKEICVIQLDHMRSKNNYLKTLQKWATRLQVQGVVLFYKHLIFIILYGNKNDIKEYLKKMRTQKVDIDSAGHACKERLMTILLRDSYEDDLVPFEGFHVHELSEINEVESLFSEGFTSMLYDILRPLLTRA